MGFGDFDFLCNKSPLPLCMLVGPYDQPSTDQTPLLSGIGLMSECYPRSIELANTIIFQVGNTFIHIGALPVILIMMYTVKGKYTAIGRKELFHFLSCFLFLTCMSLVVDAGVAPPGSSAYPYLVAIQNGAISGTMWSLVNFGFLGFQFYEDGTRRAMLFLRGTTLCAFLLTFIISLFTFIPSWGSDAIGPHNTVGLFVVLYLFNLIFVVVYILSQFALAIFILQDIWMIGAVGLGTFFFVASQILLYPISSIICKQVKHYIDGTFFATVTNLFAVMMVYKFWDMSTKEDLEFSVGQKDNMWETKELLGEDNGMSRYEVNGSEYAGSTFALNQHQF